MTWLSWRSFRMMRSTITCSWKRWWSSGPSTPSLACSRANHSPPNQTNSCFAAIIGCSTRITKPSCCRCITGWSGQCGKMSSWWALCTCLKISRPPTTTSRFQGEIFLKILSKNLFLFIKMVEKTHWSCRWGLCSKMSQESMKAASEKSTSRWSWGNYSNQTTACLSSTKQCSCIGSTDRLLSQT